MTPSAPQGQRIDKWLWCARFFRTRVAAARFVEAGSVRLTRNRLTQRVGKPGFALTTDDELAFLVSDRPVIVRVRAFASRRGSAREAALLFERISVP